MARVVLAPDSFKGSIGARDAAEAIARGWRRVRPHDVLDLRPMADGGEGTLDVLEATAGGARRAVRVAGPDGRPVDATWLELPDGTGAVELASTSGLTLQAAPRPLDADTAGFGQAIAAALDAGVRGLLLAIGGSASTDGGGGILTALGARLLDAGGAPIPRGNRGLGRLAAIDTAGLRALPPDGAVVLTDVGVPLTGPGGAAAVFGPQKGASPQQILAMDAALVRFAAMLGGEADRPGAGAAGGAGYALHRWGARIEPGAPGIAARIGLPAALAGADLVIVGEGRYDSTSRLGKAVGSVEALAAAAGVPVALVAGSIEVRPDGRGIALVDLAGSASAAMRDPHRALEAAGAALADGWDG